MENITHKISVDLISTGLTKSVTIPQYNGTVRVVEVSVYKNSVPYDLTGVTVTVCGTKPDKTIFSYDNICTVSGNVVTFPVQEQMTAVSGVVRTELRFSNASTAVFNLRVPSSAVDKDGVVSDTELSALERYVKGEPTDEVVVSAVESWLDLHPEATTTVQDGSITEAKLAKSVISKISGGLTETAKNLLITILRNGVYNADMSALITTLESALNTSDDGGDDTTIPITQPDIPLQ